MRATWKGFVAVSLVRIPIKVFPATESSATLSFNQLHAECSTRIQQQKWCPTCQRVAPASEIVKGFEFERGRYVTLTEDELDAARPPSTRVIELAEFIADVALDPLVVDRTYYLAPDGPLATEAYGLLRDALRLDERRGIGKLALYGREYLVSVRPRGDLLLLDTLRHAAEIRAPHAIPDVAAIPVTVPRQAAPAQLRLAKQVIDAFAVDTPVDLRAFRDDYQADLRSIIDKKIAGAAIVAPRTPAPQVLPLADALQRSLDLVKLQKTPAKAALKRRKAS